jgi:hypothetical protein
MLKKRVQQTSAEQGVKETSTTSSYSPQRVANTTDWAKEFTANFGNFYY